MGSQGLLSLENQTVFRHGMARHEMGKEKGRIWVSERERGKLMLTS